MPSASEVEVRLLLFAKARDLAGITEAALLSPKILRDVEELKQLIFKAHPSLGILESCVVVAINESYVEPGVEIRLQQGDQIAIIPPISGG